jgi:hypothetical protein
VLKKLGKKYKVSNWKSEAALFEDSGKLIMDICRAAIKSPIKRIKCNAIINTI